MNDPADIYDKNGRLIPTFADTPEEVVARWWANQRRDHPRRRKHLRIPPGFVVEMLKNEPYTPIHVVKPMLRELSRHGKGQIDPLSNQLVKPYGYSLNRDHMMCALYLHNKYGEQPWNYFAAEHEYVNEHGREPHDSVWPRRFPKNMAMFKVVGLAVDEPELAREMAAARVEEKIASGEFAEGAAKIVAGSDGEKTYEQAFKILVENEYKSVTEAQAAKGWWRFRPIIDAFFHDKIEIPKKCWYYDKECYYVTPETVTASQAFATRRSEDPVWENVYNQQGPFGPDVPPHI